jgi:hypothetical protein
MIWDIVCFKAWGGWVPEGIVPFPTSTNCRRYYISVEVFDRSTKCVNNLEESQLGEVNLDKELVLKGSPLISMVSATINGLITFVAYTGIYVVIIVCEYKAKRIS